MDLVFWLNRKEKRRRDEGEERGREGEEGRKEVSA